MLVARLFVRRLCIFSLFFLMSACTMVGPNYKAPELVTSDHWLQKDMGIKADSSELKDWWKVFNDPVLDSLIQAAYQQNLPLQISGVRVLEAKARLAIAVGELYPQQQQGRGSLIYTRMSENSPGMTSGVDLDYRQADLGFGASWEMDFWGRFRRAIESENANLLASMAAYDDALVSLLGDVANTYVVIRVFEQQLIIAKENVKIQRESLKIARARFEGGQSSERDVQQALSQLYSTEASIPQLETSLQQAKNALSILLGIVPNEIEGKLGGQSKIPHSPTQVTVGIPADLLRRRPDVRVAELQAMAQSAQIGVTEAELYPAFSLTGNIGLVASDSNGSDLSDVFSLSSRAGSFGPNFRWNIFNYGQITNAVRVQDARFEELLLALQNQVLIAQREVEDNLVAFLNAQKVSAFLSNAAAAARKTAQLSLIQYEGGATDYTTVINAQGALLQQENALAQAQGTIPQALIGIYRALGGGWQIREGEDFVPEVTREKMKRRTDWGQLIDSQEMEKSVAEDNNNIAVPQW